jgi:sec-independent protein translocase protein TatA
MLGGIGVQELLLIFLVALLLFGSNRIPDIARSLGKGISEFKRAMEDTKNEINRSIEEADRPRIGTAGTTQGSQTAPSPPPAQPALPQPPAGPHDDNDA